MELRVKRRAGEPLPIAGVASRFMVQQQRFEDCGATLPVNVTTPAREEAGYSVPTQMMDPAFDAQLAHERVDPGESRSARCPAAQPGFSLWGRVFRVVGGEGKACGRGYSRGKVPRDEATGGVIAGLAKCVAERGLGAEIHFTEE